MKFISTLVTQGSGVVGNLVVERNGVIRNRNNPTNPSSLLQQAVRATLAMFSQAWSGTLNAAERAAWNAHALTVVRHDALGKPIKLSGIDAYVGGNAALVQAGGTPVSSAPVLTGGYALPALTSIVIDDSANTAVLTFAAEIPANVAINFSLSPASLSQGISKYSGPYRFFQSQMGSNTVTVTITGVTVPVAGEQWAYRAIAVDDTARVSLPTTGLTEVVA